MGGLVLAIGKASLRIKPRRAQSRGKMLLIRLNILRGEIAAEKGGG